MAYNFSSISDLLRKLTGSLSSDPDGAFQLAITYLSSTDEKIGYVQDEKSLCQKIYSKIYSISPSDADKFNECYTNLKSSFVLKQRMSVLTLLLALSSSQKLDSQQHFPLPNLGNIKSHSTLSGPTTCSSKSTFGGTKSDCNILKQNSSSSLPSNKSNMAITVRPTDNSERSCISNVILAVTGVKAKGAAGYSRPLQIMYSRIAHLGFLQDHLKEFIDPSSGLMPQGLMGEGLASCIREELTEYYRSVALLQSQVCDGSGGTLRRVTVWAPEPLHRLTWLANITHAAQHKKGGELASCVHRFVRHGDERVAALARRLLTALLYPMQLMLTRWLLHGEIEDPFNEFFIESRSGVPIDRMWHDKYRVRDRMVPSFMSREQAARVLATGKSVVFVRDACAGSRELDASVAREPEHSHHLQALVTPSSYAQGECGGRAGSAWWESEQWGVGVERAHAATSQRLLAALISHHHLLDHLAAHRRYLLLAQGDFVHHLMTLLQEELNKPAASLYVHNLTCTLEAAVRATNAQFEPPHVLARLHVNLYPISDGREDNGWDVFALQYQTDGPLGTLFPAACAARYRALFTQLWRVKRIEYALHAAWRAHAILNKRLNSMPEVWGVMRRVSCVRAECVRLCGALQEASGVGAEVAWAELVAAAGARAPLDRLLELHHRALDKTCVLAMIHHTTQELQSYLGNVLNETLALRAFESNLHAGIQAELDRRDHFEKLKAERLARGEHAYTLADETSDKEHRKIFQQFLANRKADLNVWIRTFRSHVSTLILKLALHEEVALQTLAFRLDYSDFYKRSDAKLHEPLTYQHKRLSEIGLSLAKSKVTERVKKR